MSRYGRCTVADLLFDVFLFVKSNRIFLLVRLELSTSVNPKPTVILEIRSNFFVIEFFSPNVSYGVSLGSRFSIPCPKAISSTISICPKISNLYLGIVH